MWAKIKGFMEKFGLATIATFVGMMVMIVIILIGARALGGESPYELESTISLAIMLAIVIGVIFLRKHIPAMVVGTSISIVTIFILEVLRIFGYQSTLSDLFSWYWIIAPIAGLVIAILQTRQSPKPPEPPKKEVLKPEIVNIPQH